MAWSGRWMGRSLEINGSRVIVSPGPGKTMILLLYSIMLDRGVTLWTMMQLLKPPSTRWGVSRDPPLGKGAGNIIDPRIRLGLLECLPETLHHCCLFLKASETLKLHKNIEVTETYKHLYDTLDVHCSFERSGQTRAVSCFNLNAPLSEEERSIHDIHAFNRVG